MCGFVALLSSRKTDPGVLETMRDRLAHRGPDGAHSWQSRAGSTHIALGFRRLAILDLRPEADQPFLSRDGSLALVFNGEIYNYVELRAELERQGAEFRTSGDTEVLLAAYEHYGDACLDHLNGMFAFALWDARSERLFVARDRFAEKPLFWARLDDGGIAFASEMKALLAHPGVSDAVDGSTLEDYVGSRYREDGEATLFRAIKRVRGAHAMTVRASGIERAWRYWSMRWDDVDERMTPEGAVEQMRERLERSVAIRLRSDVPVGTSLSGGLDSSVLVALIARHRERGDIITQRTFSARFDDDPTLSEGPYIDAVVAATGVHPHAVQPDPLRLADESLLLHWHQEEPFLSASIYLQWCVARLARENGTTVLLDGQGADELLGGYQFYFPQRQLDLLERRRLIKLTRETRQFTRRLMRASEDFHDPSRRFNARIALSAAALLAHMRAGVPAPAGADRPGVPRAARGGRFRRVMAEALQYDSLPQLLRYADRNAMAFSREGRLPYLDHTFVEWCMRIPDDLLVRDGWQKWPLRRAGDGLLPHHVQWRADKVGYAAPLDVWMRGPLESWAHERVFAGPVCDVPGYDPVALRTLWDDHQAGVAQNSWALWRWLSLGEWLALGERGAWRNGAARLG